MGEDRLRCFISETQNCCAVSVLKHWAHYDSEVAMKGSDFSVLKHMIVMQWGKNQCTNWRMVISCLLLNWLAWGLVWSSKPWSKGGWHSLSALTPSLYKENKVNSAMDSWQVQFDCRESSHNFLFPIQCLILTFLTCSIHLQTPKGFIAWHNPQYSTLSISNLQLPG